MTAWAMRIKGRHGGTGAEIGPSRQVTDHIRVRAIGATNYASCLISLEAAKLLRRSLSAAIRQLEKQAAETPR